MSIATIKTDYPNHWIVGVVADINDQDGPDVADRALQFYRQMQRKPQNRREFMFRFYSYYYTH